MERFCVKFGDSILRRFTRLLKYCAEKQTNSGKNPALMTAVGVGTNNTMMMMILIITRKHRQSYRHADPRRQRPQVAQRRIGLRRHTGMVTSNRATETFFVTVTLTF